MTFHVIPVSRISFLRIVAYLTLFIHDFYVQVSARVRVVVYRTLIYYDYAL